MDSKALLFSGTPGGFGGLSNEKELAVACPQEFKKGNRWTEIAGYFVTGEKKVPLKWKTADVAERDRQWHCFIGLLGTFDLQSEDKIAVAGWMLSEITIESDAS